MIYGDRIVRKIHWAKRVLRRVVTQAEIAERVNAHRTDDQRRLRREDLSAIHTARYEPPREEAEEILAAIEEIVAEERDAQPAPNGAAA